MQVGVWQNTPLFCPALAGLFFNRDQEVITMRPARALIDLDALCHNYRLAREVSGAKALAVVKAERDLERTFIRAPYDGQVLEQTVDVGQVVGAGTTLGQVFAVDYVEVRLPLPERESQFLRLPQPFRDASGQPASRAFNLGRACTSPPSASCHACRCSASTVSPVMGPGLPVLTSASSSMK